MVVFYALFYKNLARIQWCCTTKRSCFPELLANWCLDLGRNTVYFAGLQIYPIVRRFGKVLVDLLSASAHKFNGPKGIGFLYIRKGTQIVSFTDGGAQESNMRAGTENVGAIVGMAVALNKSCNEMEARSRHLLALEDRLIQSLSRFNLDFCRNGSIDHIPGNISLSFRGADGEVLLHRLDLMGISVSTGSACNSKSTELSHVLKAIEAPKEYAFGTIRISLGYENTLEEVDYIAQSIKKTLVN